MNNNNKVKPEKIISSMFENMSKEEFEKVSRAIFANTNSYVRLGVVKNND